MKIGDRVRILGTSSDFLEQYIGSVGVVEYCGEINIHVRCVGGTLDNTWAFTEENLEVVSDENY